MHEEAIEKLDSAALVLIKALDQYGAEMQRYLNPTQLKALRADVVSLRRGLLGVEMGVLYQNWEPPAEILDTVVCATCDEPLPVNEAAAKVADLLKQGDQ